MAADSITEDQVVDYILAKHPNITGCFAANGDSVKLAVDGLKRNKMEKKVKVIGFDANDDEIQDLKDGTVDGLIVQNPFGMGYATVVAAARASLDKGKCVEYPGIEINLTNYSVIVDGHTVEMPPKELELLYFLASSPNQVFTREQLLDQIWGYEYIGDTRTVDVHIKRLREKIKDHNGWSLSTVWGIGYKFEVK